MGHGRICKIDERTLEVTSVADFTEAVWECVQVAGQLIVRLQSGIYLLN